MEVIEHYLYTKEHEWVNIEDDQATIGITEYAQEALGDITFIELPAIGSEVEQFEQFASVESVKAASDIYSPLSGKVTEVNNELESEPGLINKFCFDKGWMIKIHISAVEERSNLMTADEYRNYLKSLD
jgi:glycine cleavage system H protein